MLGAGLLPLDIYSGSRAVQKRLSAVEADTVAGHSPGCFSRWNIAGDDDREFAPPPATTVQPGHLPKLSRILNGLAEYIHLNW